MSGDHNQYQKPYSYLDFECPRCGHCCQALETEKQEPVAWANSFDLQNFDMKVRTCPDLHHTVPLYTAPPKQWVGLTDEEVSEIIDREIGFNSCWGPEEKFARAIEQALKEKNT
jgi:hypothetical protein